MFEINGNINRIDNKKVNPSEQYGRNAVDNFYSYIQKPITEDKFNTAPILDFGISTQASENNEKKLNNFIKENDDYLNALPPLDFEYRYMQNVKNGNIDKDALIGAANEDMMQRTEMSVEEMDAHFAPNDNFTSKALDINGDGKITNSEYATSILAADMLSKSDTPELNNIDGTINSKGMNAVLAYAKKSNASAAAELYSKIYNNYKLGD